MKANVISNKLSEYCFYSSTASKDDPQAERRTIVGKFKNVSYHKYTYKVYPKIAV